MRKKLKGAYQVLIFALIGVTIITGVIGANLFAQSETIKRSVRDSAIIEAINTVEFLKNSLNQALAFAFYQASFDVARNGGTLPFKLGELGNLVYWRIYEETRVPPYMDNINFETRDLLNKYVEALKFEGIQNPIYTEVISSFADADLKFVRVDAFTKGKSLPIVYETEIFKITDVAEMERTIRSNIYKLFDVGWKNFIEVDKIQSKLRDAIREETNTFRYNKGVVDTAHCSPDDPNCPCSLVCLEDEPTQGQAAGIVFSCMAGKGIETARQNIEDNIEPSVKSLEGEINNVLGNKDRIKTEIDIKDKKATILSSCSVEAVGRCGPNLEETMWRLECTFNFYAASDNRISITDLEQKFPVLVASQNDRVSNVLNFGSLTCSRYEESACGLS